MVFILLLIFLVGCASAPQDAVLVREDVQHTVPEAMVQEETSEGLIMELKSEVFKQGEMIPGKYTCDGDNVSPKLLISGVPKNAKSLALVMDDPDAPRGTFAHWVAWNLPVTMKELPENIAKGANVLGFKQGKNDARTLGYFGPCPPSGAHRYFFRLYALDTFLDLSSNATKADAEKAMLGHILAQAELMGKYTRA